MPHALKLDHKYRDKGLAVLLVHVQEADDLAGFILERYPGARATVVAENTIPIGPKAPFKIPRCALIGIDGKVLAEGMRKDVGREIDRLIPKELARAKKGYGASPEIARGRALLHHEGKIAAARAHLSDLQPTASARDDLRRARAEVEQRFHHDLDRIQDFLTRGAWQRARDLGDRLLREVKGVLEWEVKVEVALEPLQTPEAEAMIALDTRFEKLWRQITSRRARPADLVRLDKLLADQPEGPVVTRIRRWRDTLRRVLES